MAQKRPDAGLSWVAGCNQAKKGKGAAKPDGRNGLTDGRERKRTNQAERIEREDRREEQAGEDLTGFLHALVDTCFTFSKRARNEKAYNTSFLCCKKADKAERRSKKQERMSETE